VPIRAGSKTSATMSDRSDTHWSSTVPSKTKDLSKEALGAYKTARLYVRFIPLNAN